MCGENSEIAADGDRGIGSPPRVRGKQLYSDAIKDGARITPACAGKTSVLLIVSPTV